MSPTALIVFGGWEGHRPAEIADRLAPMLAHGGLAVELADTLAAFDDPGRLARMSVIVPCWTMGVLAGAQEQNLASAVEGGVGLAGCHGGMGDAFRSSTSYQFVVGGQFVAHPGNIIDYPVQIRDRDHPITAGLDDFAIRSEQYYMHVDPSNRVLATTTFSGEHAPWTRGCVMPVVWTRRHGAGRVFYSSIGHAPEELDHPTVLEIMRRGLRWASGV